MTLPLDRRAAARLGLAAAVAFAGAARAQHAAPPDAATPEMCATAIAQLEGGQVDDVEGAARWMGENCDAATHDAATTWIGARALDQGVRDVAAARRAAAGQGFADMHAAHDAVAAATQPVAPVLVPGPVVIAGPVIVPSRVVIPAAPPPHRPLPVRQVPAPPAEPRP